MGWTWLAEVVARVRQWIGGKLRWTWVSAFPPFEPFAAEHFEYLSCWATAFPRTPPASLADRTFHAAAFGDLLLICSGSDTPGVASPYYFQAYGRAMHGEEGDFVPALSLRVGVPVSEDAGRFRQEVCGLVENLPLRWASAGYTYAAELGTAYTTSRRIIRAHSLRYWGFDNGLVYTHLWDLFSQVRTANWLTFLGRELFAACRRHSDPTSLNGSVRTEWVGANFLLTAGQAPARGDINRLQIPAEYVAADAFLRPVRARDLDFLSPWRAGESGRWLNRFEPSLEQGRMKLP
jgi:hypothetical protein